MSDKGWQRRAQKNFPEACAAAKSPAAQEFVAGPKPANRSRHVAIVNNVRETFSGVHGPPSSAGTPRALSASTKSGTVRTPEARSSSKSVVRSDVLSDMASLSIGTDDTRDGQSCKKNKALIANGVKASDCLLVKKRTLDAAAQRSGLPRSSKGKRRVAPPAMSRADHLCNAK